MLQSTLLDIAFLGFGGALLISTIDIVSGGAALAIGLLAAFAHSAISEGRRPHRSRNGEARLVSVHVRFA
jgi:hypothetical protein